MNKFFALCFFLINVSLLFAQQDYEIDEVEVVSLHIPVSVEESGRSITVLDAADIAKLPATSVDELLRYLPGINVNSRGGFGVQTDLGMRGSTFSQVLVLIDGVRFSEPLTAHLNFSLPIPVSEIAQIEVIRGPASAMYGADAVGGLIHIKTKSFAQKQEGLSTAGHLFFGQNNLLDGDASVAYQFGKLGLSAGMKNTTSDGEEFVNPNFTNGISQNQTYNTDFDIKNYTVAAHYKPNENWKVNARYAKDDRDFNAKYFYTASGYDESRETTGNELIQASIQHGKGRSNTMLSASYRQGSDYFVFNPLFAANSHTTNKYLALLQHQFTTSKEVKLGFGLQAESQEIDSTDRGNHDQSQTEGFFTALFPLKDFNVMMSQRMGMNSDYGISYTPQLSVSYNKDKYLLRSSAGWALRAPDFTERYVSDLIPSLSPGRNLGNPNLAAEESFSVDFGADFLPSNNSKLSASVFYRDSKNLVDFVVTNESDISTANNLTEGADYLYATNVGEATTWGIEWQGQVDVNLNNQNSLNLSLDNTYLSTTLGEDIDSKYLANHPNFLANFAATLNLNKFLATWQSQYVNRNGDAIENIGAQVKDDYLLSNLKLGVEVLPDAVIYLRGTNVFNTEYQEILGSQMPGSWWSVGFQWNVE